MSLAEIAELRAAIREGHELLRDLRDERRAVKELITGIRERVQTEIAARLEQEVNKAVAELAETTERAMRDAVRRVDASFDRLAAIYLGNEPGSDPGEDLEQMTRRAVAAREFKAARQARR